MKISILLIAVIFTVLELSSCITFTVDKKSEECFYINHNENDKRVISVIFQVISGGRQDIDILVNIIHII